MTTTWVVFATNSGLVRRVRIPDPVEDINGLHLTPGEEVIEVDVTVPKDLSSWDVQVAADEAVRNYRLADGWWCFGGPH